MKPKRNATWTRIGILFATYVAIALVGYVVATTTDGVDAGMALLYGFPLVVNPIVTMVLAARDGFKEGFNLLWAIAPVVCYALPAFLLYPPTMLKLGLVYSVLGIIAHSIGALCRKPSTPAPEDSTPSRDEDDQALKAN